jgi:hypothetical protein
MSRRCHRGHFATRGGCTYCRVEELRREMRSDAQVEALIGRDVGGSILRRIAGAVRRWVGINGGR